MIPPKRLTFVHPDWGMLRRSRRVLIFFTHYVEQHSRAELQLRTIYSSCAQRELVARTLRKYKSRATTTYHIQQLCPMNDCSGKRESVTRTT